MNPMKRIGLAALLVLLGALCAASPALAGKKAGMPLDPPNGSPEPQAYGMWWATHGPHSTYAVRLECWDLSPRQEYVVCFPSGESYSVTANGQGNLSARFRLSTPPTAVWVINDTGAVVLVSRD